MARRFEQFYRMKDGETRLGEAFFNAVFRDIDLRLHTQEEIEAALKAAIEDLNRNGLRRIDEFLIPAYERIGDLTELGFLSATLDGDAPVNFDLGEKIILIKEGVERDLFQPSPYVVLSVEGDPDIFAVARTLEYVRETGAFSIDIVSRSAAVGDVPGPYYGIHVAASAGSMMATLQLVEESRTLRDQAQEGAETATEQAGVATKKASDAADSEAEAKRTLPHEGLTPPENPLQGREWIHSETKKRYTYLDGDWVETYAAQVVDSVVAADRLRSDLANPNDSAKGAAQIGIDGGTVAERFARTRETNILLKRWGAVLGGVGDAATAAQNKAALQSAIDWMYGNGGGRVIIPDDLYVGNGGMIWRPGVMLCGAGPEDSIIYCDNFAFRNAGYWDAATLPVNEQNFRMEGIGFDGRLRAPAFINLRGVSDLEIRHYMTRNDAAIGNVGVVATGIGVSGSKGGNNRNWRFESFKMDAGDYGLVLTTVDNQSPVENVEIDKQDLVSEWGSCISIARFVKNVTLNNVSAKITHHFGIGVKLWEGETTATGNGPEGITLNDYYFMGPENYNGSLPNTAVQAISAANSTKGLTVNRARIHRVTDAVRLNFQNNTREGHTFNDVWIFDAVNGYSAAEGSAPSCIKIKGGGVQRAKRGYYGQLGVGSRLRDWTLDTIAERGIEVTNYSMSVKIDGLMASNVGREAIYQTNSGAIAGWQITGSHFIECGIEANNTYPVIRLNNQYHTVTGNTFRNEGANRPSYDIGRDAASNNCVFGGNWMFGAYGYYQLTHVGDKNPGDVQRGLKT